MEIKSVTLFLSKYEMPMSFCMKLFSVRTWHWQITVSLCNNVLQKFFCWDKVSIKLITDLGATTFYILRLNKITVKSQRL